MRLYLRGKKIIVNQTLLSKLWYIAKFVLFQNITKKQEYTTSSVTGKKYDLPDT